jgi:hypothetical protein
VVGEGKGGATCEIEKALGKRQAAGALTSVVKEAKDVK